MLVIVYPLREIEIGWGDRPDGVFVCVSQSAADKFKQRLDEDQERFPNEFTVMDSAPRTAEVDENAVEFPEDFTENGMWLYRGDKRIQQLKVIT